MDSYKNLRLVLKKTGEQSDRRERFRGINLSRKRFARLKNKQEW